MQNVRGDSSAHWPALLAADFFTTDVWTHRGLLTYYTAFVLELHSRRVSRAGHDDAPGQRLRDEALRGLAGDSDILRAGRFLICDRDPKWERCGRLVSRRGGCSGYPNAGAGTKLQRLCGAVRAVYHRGVSGPSAAGRAALTSCQREFVAHCHGERNRHGLGNELIQPVGLSATSGPVRAGQRMGGMLNYYYRCCVEFGRAEFSDSIKEER